MHMIYFNTNAPNYKNHSQHLPISQGKQILLGNAFWGDMTWEVGVGNTIFKNCPVNNCYFTNDMSNFETSDAVLFHVQDLAEYPHQIYKRSDKQRWIFFMLESPGYSSNMAYTHHPWRSAFNWTMTYRLDSDIPIPYGNIRPISPMPHGKVSHMRRNIKRTDLSIAKSKQRLVAWFASKCYTASEREWYVNVLSRHIKVDVFGECGTRICKKNHSHGDRACNKMLNETYMFYLSFENSLCQDYVTEKFYKVLELDVVPIVRGGTGQDYGNVPKNWYIDTNDFKSPKALAQYLLYLKQNPREYLKYFRGKELYDFTTYYGLKELPQWCELCKKLNDEREPRKVITDITGWWNTSNCVPPTDIWGLFHYTVKPVFKGHLNIHEKVSLHDRCPFITGSLTWGR